MGVGDEGVDVCQEWVVECWSGMGDLGAWERGSMGVLGLERLQ